MAGELECTHVTAKTVYFLVRNAVGQIWNGSAFENYLTANYANYPITGTEQGTASGVYVGTMPAAAAGSYNVLGLERVGGSPAETDTKVAAGNLEWDGSVVLSLSGIAAKVWAQVLFSTYTARQWVKMVGAILFGKRSNQGTVSEQYDNPESPGTAVVVGNLTAAGNGTPTLTP